MEYVALGKTGLKVSRLCFGGLTVGPLQANLPVMKAAEVILEAFRQGVNFIDTAELYQTYPHIAAALKTWDKEVIISTKTYAYDRNGAAKSLDKAQRELNRDVIDIFMLHEQESEWTLKGHREALEYFLECKEKGIVKAVGISTHHIAAVKAACLMGEIDVIHPIVNHRGLGIVDGSIGEMLRAIEAAYDKGIGIYAMKPLGGGNLINQFEECLDYVLSIPCIHSIALGMQSVEEVIANVSYFEDRNVKPEVVERLRTKKRSLHIDEWCEGCGDCLPACKHGAIYIEDGKLRVTAEKCILCGYCGSKCKNFAIKIV
ncbi:aldo/keto reductase [Petroclostridium sp. X23]|uniref:aldo/keto reductase n=1 Tax=Petroclostridium sp. X23 TaxID=3045146 RepID=UPI0024AE1E64|nr:aldo/keto reductase [Petroclostridium sp. X23]WHH60185.1 aldo/keto reductase [Petroclostridium sp. X23]